MDITSLNPFAPDVALPQSEAPTVTPLSPAQGAGAATTQPGEEVRSFKDTVMGLLEQTNDKVVTSDKNVRDLATGKTNDLNKVVSSMEEANLALSFTIAMRSKLIEAYQEIARIQV
ncbi:MAG: flagellar hook-basal body complex protein FliE [Candidatus Eremiobacteraeota bacterium]|nr:flagellar hook-basal body complex protein FliE [Candidatus Eremiobacteraeota bacterium]MBV8355509.1 flagellar hook-basal body complex protein FliE [Candidatus Eremiobacteraeota bacterium]